MAGSPKSASRAHREIASCATSPKMAHISNSATIVKLPKEQILLTIARKGRSVPRQDHLVARQFRRRRVQFGAPLRTARLRPCGTASQERKEKAPAWRWIFTSSRLIPTQFSTLSMTGPLLTRSVTRLPGLDESALSGDAGKSPRSCRIGVEHRTWMSGESSSLCRSINASRTSLPWTLGTRASCCPLHGDAECDGADDDHEPDDPHEEEHVQLEAAEMGGIASSGHYLADEPPHPFVCAASWPSSAPSR